MEIPNETLGVRQAADEAIKHIEQGVGPSLRDPDAWVGKNKTVMLSIRREQLAALIEYAKFGIRAEDFVMKADVWPSVWD